MSITIDILIGLFIGVMAVKLSVSLEERVSSVVAWSIGVLFMVVANIVVAAILGAFI